MTPVHDSFPSPRSAPPGEGRRLHLIGPGALDRATGGDRYDARMVMELRSRGWEVTVHGVGGDLPRSDESARNALGRVLAGIPDSARVLTDGLVLGGLPGPAIRHSDRLRIVALVHHPLADETGLATEERSRLVETEARALEAVRGVVVTSRHTARRMGERFGIPEGRVRVVIPGTDPAPPASGPGPGEAPSLLCLGSLIPRKGQDVLVAALAEIRDLSWRLVCAGSLSADPAYARAVRASARNGGIADRIRFPGSVPDGAVRRLFHSSSLFVLPSRHEGYGMSLAEALARGLPVVTTTAGAIPETVPADAGIRVPPGDPEALAGALASLLGPDGGERRRKLARAARVHGARLPTWQEAAATMEAAILDLAEAEGAGDPRPRDVAAEGDRGGSMS